MFNEMMREKINCYLGDVILRARTARGLNISDASTLTGFPEDEYRAIEKYPVLTALSTLHKVMSVYGAEIEFANASNDMTLMAFRERFGSNDSPEHCLTPHLPQKPLEPQPPTK